MSRYAKGNNNTVVLITDSATAAQCMEIEGPVSWGEGDACLVGTTSRTRDIELPYSRPWL
jgi:hypothetical protein